MADSWNRLDFFIVVAGLLEYVTNVDNLNLTAIRTIRVLRPLRAINRIPSKYEKSDNKKRGDQKPEETYKRYRRKKYYTTESYN